MRRAVASSIAVLLAAVLSIAVIASTREADETTELLKLLPNGMPDISGIQTGPPTKAQIMAQMKKDGLSLNLFNQVPPPPRRTPRLRLPQRSCDASLFFLFLFDLLCVIDPPLPLNVLPFRLLQLTRSSAAPCSQES
jgi:hypothetical protein